MTAKKTSSRRSFLKNGALLAVPLATAAPAVVMADDGVKSRLAKLENEAAVRELHQTWLRRINTGATDGAKDLFAEPKSAAFDSTVRTIAADHAAEPDVIEIAPDGKRATGRFHCFVEFETPIEQDCTLAQMAHAQGTDFVRRTERRVLKVDYVKASGSWGIARTEFASV